LSEVGTQELKGTISSRGHTSVDIGATANLELVDNFVI